MGVVCDGGVWHYDTRHGPPRGRLPLYFSARVVRPPDAFLSLAKASSDVCMPLVPLERAERRLEAPALRPVVRDDVEDEVAERARMGRSRGRRE